MTNRLKRNADVGGVFRAPRTRGKHQMTGRP
jgi:hypothetical protein